MFSNVLPLVIYLFTSDMHIFALQCISDEKSQLCYYTVSMTVFFSFTYYKTVQFLYASEFDRNLTKMFSEFV